MNDNAQGVASALWVLHHVGTRTEAEGWARTAVQRGASQELADATLAQWDRENAPQVVGASIPAHLRTDTLPDYLRQKGEL